MLLLKYTHTSVRLQKSLKEWIDELHRLQKFPIVLFGETKAFPDRKASRLLILTSQRGDSSTRLAGPEL